MNSNTVSLQRPGAPVLSGAPALSGAPSGAPALPQYNSQGSLNQQYKPPMPQQQYPQPQQYPQQQQYSQPQQYPQQQYGAPPQYGLQQFNLAGAPPPLSNYSSAPPPYANAPPTFGQQQAYNNPPLQQFPTQQPNIPAGAQGFVGSVSLQKGGNMSLSKANPNLVKVRIGLGWDVRQTGGPAFDLDASAFMLKGDGRVRASQDLIFYNNKQSMDGSVFHHGDNLTGAGEGDDEIVSIDLTRVPQDIQKIVFVCSIYEAEMRQQNFGMVSRAFIRVVDDFTNQEICRYDLSEEASLLSSMIFGEVYRYNNEWKFRAVGQGIQGGLKAIGGMFGLNLQ